MSALQRDVVLMSGIGAKADLEMSTVYQPQGHLTGLRSNDRSPAAPLGPI
jgi:hypothetical protein